MSVSVHVCVLERCTQRECERDTHTRTHTGAKFSIEGLLFPRHCLNRAEGTRFQIYFVSFKLRTLNRSFTFFL